MGMLIYWASTQKGGAETKQEKPAPSVPANPEPPEKEETIKKSRGRNKRAK